MGDSQQHQRRYVATIQIPMRWGDMDALGHLNNTLYFRFFEEGRISWLRGLQAQPSEGEGFLLASAACNFRRPVLYPESVTVATFVSDIGRSSLSLYQEIRSAADSDVLYADGASRLVWADFAKGRSLPLPDSLRAQLAAQSMVLDEANRERR